MPVSPFTDLRRGDRRRTGRRVSAGAAAVVRAHDRRRGGAAVHPRGTAAGQRVFLNEVQGFMSEDDKAAARALALDVIRNYRDRGCPEPAPVEPAQLHRMMNWIVAGEVADEYADDARGDGPRPVTTPVATNWFPPRLPRRVSVLVIGARSPVCWRRSGCRQAGIPSPSSRRIRASAAPGGRTPTRRPWTSGNHFYCYSFEPSDHWTEFFARQPELQSPFRRRRTAPRPCSTGSASTPPSAPPPGTTPPPPGR